MPHRTRQAVADAHGTTKLTNMEGLIKVLESISSLPIHQLIQVCSHLDVWDVVEKPKDCLRIVRKLLTHINSEKVEESDDGGVELLQTLDSFINNLKPESEDEPVSINPTLKKKDQRSPPKLENSESSTAQPSANPTDVARLLRREFKISGQIGEPGQKDCLSCTSLANQIETRLEKGYSDQDID